MLKMKTPNIPIHLPNRFNVSKKIDPPLLTSPSMGPVIPDVIPAEPAPNEKSISSSLPASIKSDNAANQPTSEYDKNNQLYRRQLSSVIDEAKLLEYPETRFKKLINDLSLSQLAVFADQIDQFGVKKLSKAGGYEKLMRNLLSDQESALSISADEKESPIRPCVWLGIDTVKEKEMAISGYYYRNGHYYTQISKAGKSYNIDLGSKIPSEVAVEAKQTTAWDMFGDQIRLFMELCTTPAFVLDTAYYAAVYFGVPAFLPAGLSPSDLPYLNELLEEIDPWAHTAHIKKETVILRIVTHHLNTSENELHVVQFDTYHAE